MKPSFAEEQANLADRVRRDEARFVFIDPDGTLPDWVAVVIRHKTGVVYGTQCAGLSVEQRFVEGYLVPLGGAKFDVDEGAIEVDPLREVFHEEGNCQWRWTGTALPPERFAMLCRLVEAIPYCRCGLAGSPENRTALRIDTSRTDEIAEAWLPVETPDGAGVLLYANCD